MTTRDEPGQDLPQGNAAYLQLLDEIRQGRLLPGDRLRETELADRLGVSRTPVREAIRQLEADGLVVHAPRQGATVRRLDYAEVMELYEMGVLTKEQLGIDAKFGSAQALAYFAEITAKGEGFGKEIGQGSKRLCTKYGHPELSMSVKGQEFPAYDSRGIQGMGLTYATSNRGACHLRSYTVASEIMGIPVKTDPLTAEGKPELVIAFQDATAAFDAAGICIFTSFAWGLPDVADQVAAACGPEFTLENMAKIGERIWNMERDFNNRAGFTSKDDTLPPRLLNEPAKTGPAKGLVNKLPEMLPKYYQLRGWDADGQLKADTRVRLGL